MSNNTNQSADIDTLQLIHKLHNLMQTISMHSNEDSAVKSRWLCYFQEVEVHAENSAC